MFAVRGCGASRKTHFSSSRVLWSRASRGFPVRSSSCSFGGRFSGNVTSLSSLQLRSTHWRKSGKEKTWPAEVVQVVLMLCCRRISLTIHCTVTAKCRNHVCWLALHSYNGLGLPAWLSCWRIRLQCRRPGFDPCVGKIPWRRKWQPTPVFLPGESHRQRSLAGYSPWGCKESEMTEWLHHHHYPVTPEYNQC